MRYKLDTAVFILSLMLMAMVASALLVPRGVSGQGQNFQPSINEYITPWSCGQGRAVSSTTGYDLNEVYIPAQLTFSKMSVVINTGDAGDLYSWGLYDTKGNLLASNVAATVGASTGSLERTNSQGAVTVGPGNYLISVVGNNVTALFGYGGSTGLQHWTTSTTNSGGQVATGIVVAATVDPNQGVQRSTLCVGFR